jgi:hypothetical protein
LRANAGDGRFRKQYETHAATTPWGTETQGCGSSTLVRIKDGYVQVRPALCDTWACKLCGVKRAAWLKREVHHALFAYSLTHFWTLTLSTERCTAAESFKVVTAAWNIVRRNLVRDYGPFSYVWVMETTKRGYAHLHLLTSLDIDKRELKRRWYHATDGSYQVDVQSAASERAANYITKYCAQQAHERRRQGNDALRHKHVYGKSMDVRLPCFRCGQPHAVGQESCATTDEGWVRWQQPYKDAVELLSREMALEAAQFTKTPCAALRASEGLDLAALLERLGGQAAAELAAWIEPEPMADELAEALPAELEDFDAFMAAMGVQYAPS